MTTSACIRDRLLTDVIRRFGFEDRRTIAFARRCEELAETDRNDARLIRYRDALMALPIGE